MVKLSGERCTSAGHECNDYQKSNEFAHGPPKMLQLKIAQSLHYETDPHQIVNTLLAATYNYFVWSSVIPKVHARSSVETRVE